MPRLTVRSSNQTVQVRRGERLSDVCETNDLAVDLACRSGACGTCLVQVVENPESLTPRSDVESRYFEVYDGSDDARLACQCHIVGDVTIDTF